MTIINSLPSPMYIGILVVCMLIAVWSLIFQMNTPQQKPNKIIVYALLLLDFCLIINRLVEERNVSETIQDITTYIALGALFLFIAIVFYRAYKNIKSGNGKR